MRSGILVEEAEVKALIAKRYNVPVKNVIRSRYNYIVLDVKCEALIEDKEKEGEDE